MSADGVRGGLISKSDRVVVCDLRSAVEALTASSGLGSSVAVVWVSVDVADDEGARDDWKCVRSVCVFFVTSMSALRSLGFVISWVTVGDI